MSDCPLSPTGSCKHCMWLLDGKCIIDEIVERSRDE